MLVFGTSEAMVWSSSLPKYISCSLQIAQQRSYLSDLAPEHFGFMRALELECQDVLVRVQFLPENPDGYYWSDSAIE